MKRIHYPVSGEVCLRYLTRHWKGRPARGKERIRQFLRWFYGGDDTLAKKAFAQITCRGLGSLELLIISDLIDEWSNGEWEIKEKELVRLTGDPHWRKNLNKANKAKSDKAESKRQLEKDRKREEKRQEKERIDRAMLKLIKDALASPIPLGPLERH